MICLRATGAWQGSCHPEAGGAAAPPKIVKHLSPSPMTAVL
jgi:hypothetical protein